MIKFVFLQLGSLCRNDSNWRNTNLIIDSCLNAIDCCHLSCGRLFDCPQWKNFQTVHPNRNPESIFKATRYRQLEQAKILDSVETSNLSYKTSYDGRWAQNYKVFMGIHRNYSRGVLVLTGPLTAWSSLVSRNIRGSVGPNFHSPKAERRECSVSGVPQFWAILGACR